MRAPTSLFLIALLACNTTDPAVPGSDRAASTGGLASGGAAQITVYGQNIYVGTDVDAVITALGTPNPDDDFPALLNAIGLLHETDFTVRAGLIAREMAHRRPHVAGFNEISQIDVDLTPLGVPLVAHEDFLPELMAALAGQGLNYVVAGQVLNIVADPFPGVHLADYDVVLVDAERVSVGAGVVARNFTVNLGTVAPGVTLQRGWVSIPLTIGGQPYTVVATHPESNMDGVSGIELIREAQMAELLTWLPGSEPTILLGDFNDPPGSLMYQVLTGGGFVDAWADLRPGVPGFTCCNDVSLRGGSQPGYYKRLDYVFVRGMAGPNGSLTGQINLFGANPSDQASGPDYPLWPSDHAGLIARLVIPAAILP